MFARTLLTLPIVLLLAGCPIDDGDRGATGPAGNDGAPGVAGINCWDLNMNRIDDTAEDINGDGVYDARDCTPQPVVAQSQDAILNHQHFCEAFAALGQYPQGCPSAVHSTPTGTLTYITNLTLFDDLNGGWTTCNNPPNDGLLRLEYRPTTKYAYWVLEKGYIANSVTQSRVDVIDNKSCRDLCTADPKCVASYARTISSQAMECFTMYHSDTITNDFEYICGINETGDLNDARTGCLDGLGVNTQWYSICP